jgi:hypothetical protein
MQGQAGLFAMPVVDVYSTDNVFIGNRDSLRISCPTHVPLISCLSALSRRVAQADPAKQIRGRGRVDNGHY